MGLGFGFGLGFGLEPGDLRDDEGRGRERVAAEHLRAAQADEHLVRARARVGVRVRARARARVRVRVGRRCAHPSGWSTCGGWRWCLCTEWSSGSMSSTRSQMARFCSSVGSRATSTSKDFMLVASQSNRMHCAYLGDIGEM